MILVNIFTKIIFVSVGVRRAKKQTNPFILWDIARLAPLFRGFEIEYEGMENISGDETFIKLQVFIYIIKIIIREDLKR